MNFHYRTVFISDTHLRFRTALADELSAFLKHVRCNRPGGGLGLGGIDGVI